MKISEVLATNEGVWDNIKGAVTNKLMPNSPTAANYRDNKSVNAASKEAVAAAEPYVQAWNRRAGAAKTSGTTIEPSHLQAFLAKITSNPNVAMPSDVDVKNPRSYITKEYARYNAFKGTTLAPAPAQPTTPTSIQVQPQLPTTVTIYGEKFTKDATGWVDSKGKPSLIAASTLDQAAAAQASPGQVTPSITEDNNQIADALWRKMKRTP